MPPQPWHGVRPASMVHKRSQPVQGGSTSRSQAQYEGYQNNWQVRDAEGRAERQKVAGWKEDGTYETPLKLGSRTFPYYKAAARPPCMFRVSVRAVCAPDGHWDRS